MFCELLRLYGVLRSSRSRGPTPMKVLIERSPRRPLAERTGDELSSRTLLLGVLASSKTQARRSLEINHTHREVGNAPVEIS